MNPIDIVNHKNKNIDVKVCELETMFGEDIKTRKLQSHAIKSNSNTIIHKLENKRDLDNKLQKTMLRKLNKKQQDYSDDDDESQCEEARYESEQEEDYLSKIQGIEEDMKQSKLEQREKQIRLKEKQLEIKEQQMQNKTLLKSINSRLR